VGVFDFFKRRRQRERTLSQALPLSGGFARGEEGNGNGHVDIHIASRTLDLRDTPAREELLELMHEHGVDPQPGSGEIIDAASVPGLQQAIIDALKRHGVDVGEPGTVDHDDLDGESRRN
jgi:hypothetical protein